MTTLTEGTHPGEFLVMEGENNYSRDLGVILSGQNLVAGQVLGKVTASGKWKEHDPALTDGSQNAAAILFDAVNATAGDKTGVIIARHAQVNGDELVWKTGVTTPQKNTANAALAAVGIIVR